MNPFRLRWQRSWPERDADYTGSLADAPKKLARIYKDDAADSERAWRWTVLDDQQRIGDGYALDADAAARAAEEAYFEENRTDGRAR